MASYPPKRTIKSCSTANFPEKGRPKNYTECATRAKYYVDQLVIATQAEKAKNEKENEDLKSQNQRKIVDLATENDSLAERIGHLAKTNREENMDLREELKNSTVQPQSGASLPLDLMEKLKGFGLKDPVHGEVTPLLGYVIVAYTEKSRHGMGSKDSEYEEQVETIAELPGSNTEQEEPQSNAPSKQNEIPSGAPPKHDETRSDALSMHHKTLSDSDGWSQVPQ